MSSHDGEESVIFLLGYRAPFGQYPDLVVFSNWPAWKFYCFGGMPLEVEPECSALGQRISFSLEVFRELGIVSSNLAEKVI